MELVHYGVEIVKVNGKEYSYADLKKLEPNYHVPFGFQTRVYRKGVEHYATDGMTAIKLSLNDPYCDEICSREGELARLSALLDIEKKKANR